MDLIVFLLFCASGLAVGKIVQIAIFGTQSKDSEKYPSKFSSSEKNPTFITHNHNHVVNNHLHITERQLKELNKK